VINHSRMSENIDGAAARARLLDGAGGRPGLESGSLPSRRLIEVCGVRRRVHASEFLFLPGDHARYWYLLEEGCLRVFAPGADGRGSLVPMLGPANFFSFGSGGRHELVCEAVVASTVICFDRRKVEGWTRHDPALATLLEKAARYELTLTRRCATVAVGGETGKRRPARRKQSGEALEFSPGGVLHSRQRARAEPGTDDGGRGAIHSRVLRHGE
jgi:CRP-like cAMP-binding protein